MDLLSGLNTGRGNTGAAWTVLAALLVTGSGAVGVASPVARYGIGPGNPERAPPGRGVLAAALANSLPAGTSTSAASPPKLANSRASSPQTIRIRLATTPRVAALSQAGEVPSRPFATNPALPFLAHSAPALHAQISPAEPPSTQPVGFKLTQGAPYALLASAVTLSPAQAPGSASVMATSNGVEPPAAISSHEEETNASLASAASMGTPGVTAQPSESGLVGSSEQGVSIYKVGAHGIELEVEAVVNGTPAGKVPLLIADGENISVRLADILKAIQPLMEPLAYETLSASNGAGEYVTFNTLRASGVAVGFNANDQLILGSN